MNYKIPTSPWKDGGATNKFLDGKVFDPAKAVDYIYSFDIKTVAVQKMPYQKQIKL